MRVLCIVLLVVLAALALVKYAGSGSRNAESAPSPTVRHTGGSYRQASSPTVLHSNAPQIQDAPTHSATPRPSPTHPPTSTATPVPPTSTSTPVPPTPSATATLSPIPTSTETHTPTPVPSPTRQAAPVSWLRDETLLTIYGRAFGVAPILGRLGIDNNFADLEWQVQPYARGIKANNGGKETRIAVHLIYGMAVPCSDTANCLLYLDDVGVNIVKQYIEPAARRHWLVVLDDQLGRSDPVGEVRRLAAKGYLAYDNVEIALDPEFRTGADQPTPGIPVGSVDGTEINAAQAYVNAYSAHHHLLHRKVLIVHQFQLAMIQNRAAIRGDFPWVDPVFVADGFGPPGAKAGVYNQLLGPGVSKGIRWRGIKLFLPNPYETTHHSDEPPMTWSQALGRQKAVDSDGAVYYVRPGPNLIVIA